LRRGRVGWRIGRVGMEEREGGWRRGNVGMEEREGGAGGEGK